MKRYRKKTILRIVSFVLIVVMGIGLLHQSTMAKTYNSPSIVLLESMLNGDRKWVVDTLVENNRLSNPYGNSESLMEDVLGQYQNIDDPDYKRAYSIMVDMLINYYYNHTWSQNLDAYMADFAGEVTELFSSNESLISFVDDLKKTVEEEQFGDILYGVFSDKYVSSWGESVNVQEESLQQLNEFQATIDNMKKVTDYWSALYSFESKEEEAETIVDYMDTVAKPLYEAGTDYLKALESMSMQEQQLASSAIGVASTLAVANWAASHSTTFSGCQTLTSDLLDMVAGERAATILNIYGSGLELTSGMLNQYTFLHSVAHQQETYYDTLNRMATQAYSSGEVKMGDTLVDYASKMDDAVDKNQLGYDILVNRIASSEFVEKDLKVSNALKAAVPTELKNAYKAANYAGLANVFNTGMQIIDEATGLKTTCIKTSELVYLQKMIMETRAVYYSDLSEYRANKTDENAQKVLTDLQMLQRLRLRGENIAYKMTKNQLNSWIGRLISGYNSGDWKELVDDNTSLAVAWGEHYQQSVDALIGASVDPISRDGFSVASGETLLIYYDSTKNTYKGVLSRSGKATNIYEMQYRIMNGINLNGGAIRVLDATVPFITATAGSNITIDASTVRIGELTQKGNGTLNIVNGDLEFQNSLELSEATLNLNGATIQTPDVIVNGNLNVSDGIIETEGLHMNEATITGTEIICTGTVDATSSKCSGLTLCGNGEQKVSGTINVGNLVLDNKDDKGIVIDGQLNVTGMLRDLDNIISSGLALQGNADVQGDILASDIILNGGNITHPVTFERGVTVTGDAKVSGGTVRGALNVKQGKLTNRENELLVKNDVIVKAPLILEKAIDVRGDVICENTSITIEDTIKLTDSLQCSDMNIYLPLEESEFVLAKESILNEVIIEGNGKFVIDENNNSISGSDNIIENMEITGSRRQTIDLSGTINNLTISNSSLFGTTINGVLTVEDSLNAVKQKIINGTKIVLNGQADLNLENVQADISINGWNGKMNGKLNGDIYASGTNSFSQSLTLYGGIVQNGGVVNFEDVVLTLKGAYTQKSGTLNISDASEIQMNGENSFAGSVNNNGKLHLNDQNVFSNVLNNTGNIEAGNVLNISGTCNNDGKIHTKHNLQLATYNGTGEVLLERDLTTSVVNTISDLEFLGTSKQTVNGSDIYVDRVVNSNTENEVQLNSQLYIIENLSGEGYFDGKRPILTSDYTYSGATSLANVSLDNDISVNGSLTLSGTSTILQDANVVVKGDFNVSGTVTISQGAVVEVKGKFVPSSATVVIEEGANLKISGNTISANSTISLDGEYLIIGDAVFTNGSISGNGKLVCIGDLVNSTNIKDLGFIGFNGKAPQVVSGNNIYVENVEILNNSRKGVGLNNYIYYSGSKDIIDGCVVNENYIVEVIE